MAKGRVARRGAGGGRGRVQVALGLLAFLLVASGVIARRAAGAAKARQLLELDRTRSSLESERIKLVNDIRNATSFSRIAPLVSRRLGLRTPADSQIIRLPRPGTRGSEGEGQTP